MSNLESSCLRGPFDSLSQTIRNSQKILAADLSNSTITAAVKSIHKSTGNNDSDNINNTTTALNTLLTSLQSLKRKLIDSERMAIKQSRILSNRLDYVNNCHSIIEQTTGTGKKKHHHNHNHHHNNNNSDTANTTTAAADTATTVSASVSNNGESSVSNGNQSNGNSINGTTATATESNSNGTIVSNGDTKNLTNGHSISNGNSNSNNTTVITSSNSSSIRLIRSFCDYLLRHGYYTTATSLANNNNIRDLIDLESFISLKKMIDLLLINHDCSKSLSWCGENRSRLNKLNLNQLEFQLRLQEFIQLIKQQKIKPAIDYARKYLATAAVQSNNNNNNNNSNNNNDSAAANNANTIDPSIESRLNILQEAMTILLYSTNGLLNHSEASTATATANNNNTSLAFIRYSHYFSDNRWDYLADLVRIAHLQLNGLNKHSNIHILINTGLAAIKTLHCKCNNTNSTNSNNSNLTDSNCPVCSPIVCELASTLPLTARTHTSLVCRLSGELMDEHNPPLVLPNGQLYSKKALLAQSTANPNQLVTCQVTHQTFEFKACKPAFIL